MTNQEPEPIKKMREALAAMEKASSKLSEVDRQLDPFKAKRQRLVETIRRETQNFYDAIGKENPYA